MLLTHKFDGGFIGMIIHLEQALIDSELKAY